jgi:hypothetical protein
MGRNKRAKTDDPVHGGSQRAGLTAAMKKQIVQRFLKSTKMKQQQLCDWANNCFKESLSKPIHVSTIGKILKDQHRWLAARDDDANSHRSKQRKGKYRELEAVLKEWMAEVSCRACL